jgi:hypothetical protein
MRSVPALPLRSWGRESIGFSVGRNVSAKDSNLRSLPGLAEPNEACYLARVSTLSEMEAAVNQLPHHEQELLLEHLARKLRTRPPATEGSRAQRERWLQKLDYLRNRGSTGKTGVPLQEILDDIRAECR